MARAARTRRLVTLGGEHYPPLLANIADPPLALWVEGANPAALVRRRSSRWSAAAIRRAAGRDTAEQFSRYLAERGLTITSGLAIGIDGASHRGALRSIGRTDRRARRRPRRDLSARARASSRARIAERWLLVSEYPPGTSQQAPLPAAQPHHRGPHARHARRRGDASQRLADHGEARADYGREVFAIPGSIHNPLARGCHRLIRSGAKLVEEAADIFVELAPQLKIDLARVPPPSANDRIATPTRRSGVSQGIGNAGIRAASITRSHRPFRIDGGGAFLHAPRARIGRVCRGAARRSV